MKTTMERAQEYASQFHDPINKRAALAGFIAGYSKDQLMNIPQFTVCEEMRFNRYITTALFAAFGLIVGFVLGKI